MGKQLTPGVLQSYLHVGLGGGCLEVVSLTLPGAGPCRPLAFSVLQNVTSQDFPFLRDS